MIHRLKRTESASERGERQTGGLVASNPSNSSGAVFVRFGGIFEPLAEPPKAEPPVWDYKPWSVCVLAMLVWWFAAVDSTGKAVIREYVLYRDCKANQELMERIPTLKVTTCQFKELA